MESGQMRAAVNSWARAFDGSQWLLLMEASAPLEETVLVVATTADVVQGSAAPAPTGLSIVRRHDGRTSVVIVEVVLFDDPDNPLRIAALVNPAASEGQRMLAQFAGQDTVQLVFMDCVDGGVLGRRVMAFDTELRTALADALAADEPEPTAEQWAAAVEHVRLVS